MNLKERLQQLALQKEKLLVSIYEVNGAMKILEEQILETEQQTKGTMSIDKKNSNIE